MDPLPITHEDVEQTQLFTTNIMVQCPNRVAGSESCLKGADLIQNAFSKHCDAGSVSAEDFTFHGPSNVKITRPAITTLYIGIVFIMLDLEVIGLIISLLPLWMMLSQIMCLWDHFDIFFKKTPGKNVVGEILPEQASQRTIYLTGHHDATYIYQVMARYPKIYPYSTLGSVVLLGLAILSSTVIIIAPNLRDGIQLFLLICVIISFPLMVLHWNFTTSEISPGGGDNLISVGIINQIAKKIGVLKQAGKNPLQTTTLKFIALDAEESGLKGAKAYNIDHNAFLQQNADQIYVLNLDSFYYLNDLCVVNKDQNGFVQNSKEMNKDLISVSHELGYEMVTEKNFMFGTGAVDSARFSMNGIRATTILGIHPDPSSLKHELFYHTRKDLVANIDPTIIEAVLKIVLGYIEKLDY
jgi:aminopeptidase YwaD